MSSQHDPVQVVIFSLGGEEYAMPIEHVREIIRYTKPRPVASTDPWVRGVLSLRGHLVPVHDLADRLGAASTIGEHTKIVIIDTTSTMVGVIVDGVEEVLMIDRDHIEAAPGADETIIDSIVEIGERLVVLLNPSTIFSSSAMALG